MAPATRNRRPLPRRVYWVRRLLALAVVGGVVLALVLGIARLLDYSTDGSGGDQAAPVASSPEPSADRARNDKQPQRHRRDKREKAGRNSDRDKVARPEGPCADGDVLVTPKVGDANLGAPVRIVLEVTSIEADACYWEVSPESVYLNIESDYGTIWSSQHCPAAVPTERVVPRRERAAKVALWWNGMESDEGCPVGTLWVDRGGNYTAVAAARGSVTPVSTGFFLGPAVAATVTRTPTPTATPTPTPTPTREAKQSAKPERGGGAGGKKQGDDR